MEKSKKRSLVSGLAALALVLLLLYIVFRDKLPEIISALSEVSVPGVCLLLAMGLGYQLIDSAMCMTLLRSRLPELPIDYKLAVRQEDPHYGNAGVVESELGIFVPLLVEAGVEPETAEQDACRMEHVISENSFRHLKQSMDKKK